MLAWRSKGAKVLAAPLLPPQPIDIGFLLTLPQDQMSAWEDFLVSVLGMFIIINIPVSLFSGVSCLVSFLTLGIM